MGPHLCCCLGAVACSVQGMSRNPGTSRWCAGTSTAQRTSCPFPPTAVGTLVVLHCRLLPLEHGLSVHSSSTPPRAALSRARACQEPGGCLGHTFAAVGLQATPDLHGCKQTWTCSGKPPLTSRPPKRPASSSTASPPGPSGPAYSTQAPTALDCWQSPPAPTVATASCSACKEQDPAMHPCAGAQHLKGLSSLQPKKGAVCSGGAAATCLR